MLATLAIGGDVRVCVIGELDGSCECPEKLIAIAAPFAYGLLGTGDGASEMSEMADNFGPRFDLDAIDGESDGRSFAGWDLLLPAVTLGVPGVLVVFGTPSATVNLIGGGVSVVALFVRGFLAQKQLEDRFDNKVPQWRIVAVLAALLCLTAVDFCGNVAMVITPIPPDLVAWAFALFVAYLTFMFLGVWSDDLNAMFSDEW